ncbi:hypothetical protein EV182_003559 [Spiromyces aspiralis]|uniref:Uncharacterized protein n=1 Tax=Spiromyces aspiralis TaxID=68401 RepID=A0ACC1HCI8_9FUNG|nr:hypothetical protein EV182_003559 [Spiromyces aspiralis]
MSALSSSSSVTDSSGGGILNDIYQSIFQPGEVNQGVIKVMNAAFIGLFVVLAFLMYATGGNWHVVFLSIIAVGLFASIQWFIAEYKCIRAEKERTKPAKGDSLQSKKPGIPRPTASLHSRKPKRL